jgi:hypothetical protein
MHLSNIPYGTKFSTKETYQDIIEENLYLKINPNKEHILLTDTLGLELNEYDIVICLETSTLGIIEKTTEVIVYE